MEVQIPQKKGAIFGGCPSHSNQKQSVVAAFAASGIIQSPVTSCSSSSSRISEAIIQYASKRN